MSGKKNRNLCERPYCRKPWEWMVSRYEAHWKRSWLLYVCFEHAEPYIQSTSDTPGLSVIKRAA